MARPTDELERKVYGLFGLREGEAHVVRNAGGVVTDDVIRSLAISRRLPGTREIILVHHTDSGMLTFRDDEVKAEIERDTRHSSAVRPRGVRRRRCRRPPIHRSHQGEPLRPTPRRGRSFVYEVEKGTLRRVN